MFLPAIKIAIAACVISFASWLSNKRPELAGFIIALPLSTLLALFFSYSQYQDAASSVKFAKSIFAAIPMSLLFFVPFLLADRLKLFDLLGGFWGLYAAGVALIAAGYFAHGLILKLL